MYQQKKTRHTRSPNHRHPLQSNSLERVHHDPNLSATIEAVLKILLSQYLLQFRLDLLYTVKSSPIQFDFHPGKEVTEG